MTTCVISQPRLFPALHYLHRMLETDVFVVLDNVRFNPRHEENRTRLPAPDGHKWLTAPVRGEDRRALIRDVRVNTGPEWTASVHGVLRGIYRDASRFAEHEDEIMAIIEAGHGRLIDLTMASWEPAIQRLGITCEFVHASDIETSATGADQLIEICSAVGATHYVSGAFGRKYLDLNAFASRGITVGFHSFEPAPYPQTRPGWTPFLSYLDALVTVGLERGFLLPQGATEWEPMTTGSMGT